MIIPKFVPWPEIDNKLVIKNTPIFFLYFGLVFNTLGQDPSSVFSFDQDGFCINENLGITNTSTDATSYLWDYCFESLVQDGEYTDLGSQGVNNVEGIELVYEQGVWNGFINDRSTGVLKRLGFGSSLTNTPSISDVSLSGSAITDLNDIRLIEEDGVWYGIGIGYRTEKVYR
ncbi:MAG: hypothetical protein CMB80_24350, partial [Flammeovirgaceae bacterium]|nr:hypothetical protein [Flammeovirgaceae bacterium]